MTTRYVRLWRVYDNVDPAGTDTWCTTKAEAQEVAAGMDAPCEIDSYRIPLTKSGVMLALNDYPQR